MKGRCQRDISIQVSGLILLVAKYALFAPLLINTTPATDVSISIKTISTLPQPEPRCKGCGTTVNTAIRKLDDDQQETSVHHTQVRARVRLPEHRSRGRVGGVSGSYRPNTPNTPRIAKAKADLKRRENEIARLTETLSVDGTSSACSTISSRSNKASSMGGLGMASSAALSTSTQPVVVQPVRKVDTGGGMWGFDAPSNLPMLMPTGEIVYPRKARPKPPRSERIRKEKEEAEKRERDRSLQEQFRMNTKTREMNDAKALHDLERAAIGRQREEMARDAERIDVVQSEQARVRSKSLTGDPFKQLHSHQNNLHKSKSTPAQQSQHEKFKTYPIPEPTFAFDDGISLADTKCASSFHVSGLKKLFRK